MLPRTSSRVLWFVVGVWFSTIIFSVLLIYNLIPHHLVVNSPPTGGKFVAFRSLKTSEQEETSPNAEPSQRTVIVYSGPTKSDCEEEKNKLYHENFRFFLSHGLPCSYEPAAGFDVIIVLTNETYIQYKNVLSTVNAECGGVKVLLREDRCYDMESHRVALSFINRSKYEHFVFLNCGLIGPMQPVYSHDIYWASTITKYITAETKLVGLSVNCGCYKFICGKPHVQSFLWATDTTGLQAILQAEAIFDCGHQLAKSARDDAIMLYEIGMSQAIIEAGYSIRPVNYIQGLNMTFSLENYRKAPYPEKCIDIWNPRARTTLDISMSPLDSLFWKSSLSVTDQLKQYITFQDENHAAMYPTKHLSRQIVRQVCGFSNQTEDSEPSSMWWRRSSALNTWMWQRE